MEAGACLSAALRHAGAGGAAQVLRHYRRGGPAQPRQSSAGHL